jgi:hypothetical protein
MAGCGEKNSINFSNCHTIGMHNQSEKAGNFINIR